MPAKSIRHAAAVVALLAGTRIGHAQMPAAIDVYREAVATYVKTGNPAIAIKPLEGWNPTLLATVVKETAQTADADLLEAAATLHLEIGVAIAGLSTPSTKVYFDHGSQLIDRLTAVKPTAATNRNDHRKDVATIRATWYGVAGSAFLSISDVFSAKPLLAKALRIAPESPSILTLHGTADEMDGVGFKPEEVDSPVLRERANRQRTALLLSAQRSYRIALQADSNYALAHIRLGRTEFLLNNIRQARESLQKGTALAHDPSHRYLAALFTGAFLQDQKDLAGARAAFERALEISPRSQSAVVGLAYIELMAGRPDRAQALARGYLGSPQPDEAWWAYKNGTLDQEGLMWLRRRLRK